MPPQFRRIPVDHVGAQQVAPFPPEDLLQFPAPQTAREPGIRIPDPEVDQMPGPPGLLLRRPELEQQLVTAVALPLQCNRPF